MGRDYKDKRKEKRYDVELLPESLKKFYIHFSNGDEALAEIKNASMHGFGIRVSLSSEHFIVGTKLVLYPAGKDYALYGKIVHKHEIAENQTQVGLQLLKTEALKKYQKILESI